MTELDWRTCTNPHALLEWLHQQGKLSARKARLHAVASLRRVWPLLPDERSQNAVEVAERYADGLASNDDLRIAEAEAEVAYEETRPACEAARSLSPEERGHGQDNAIAVSCAALAAAATCRKNAKDASGQSWYGVVMAEVSDSIPEDAKQWDAVWRMLDAKQAELIRALFNPFRLESFDPAWRTPEVLSLAKRVYEQSSFVRLPDLAQALGDLRCHDAELLGQLRGGPQVKGLWALDAVLARE